MEYDQVHNFYNGFAEVKKDGKWGFIDRSGELICNIEYSTVFSFENGVARVIKNKKQFLMNRKGETLLVC